MKARSVVTKKLLKFVVLPTLFISAMFFIMDGLNKTAVEQVNTNARQVSFFEEDNFESYLPITNISKGMDKKGSNISNSK